MEIHYMQFVFTCNTAEMLCEFVSVQAQSFIVHFWKLFTAMSTVGKKTILMFAPFAQMHLYLSK